MAELITRCIQGLYTSAMDPAAWVPTLNDLASLFDADTVNVGPLAMGTRASFKASDVADERTEEYRRRWVAHDPLADALEARPVSLFEEGEIVPLDRRGVRFYEEYAASFSLGMRFGLTVEPLQGQAIAMMVSRVEPPSPKDKYLLSILRSHLTNAADLALDQDRRRSEDLKDVIDALSVGAGLTNASGRAIHANARLLALHGRGLSVVSDSWKAELQSEQPRLSAFLQSAGAGKQGAMALQRSDGRRPLLVEALPLPPPRVTTPLYAFEDQVLSALVVLDPEDDSSALDLWALRLQGLAKQQARIASLIAEGRSLEEIAEICSIMVSTLRVHIKTIKRKLGVNRHTEIAVLVNRLRSPLHRDNKGSEIVAPPETRSGSSEQS